MSSTPRSRLLLPALAAAAAVALAACSGDTTSTGPAGQATMSQAEANAASDVIVADLASQSDGSNTSSAGASFSVAAQSGASASLASSAAVGAWYATACSPPPTVTVNGSTTTYVFDNCAISRLIPLEKITRNGQVDVTLALGARSVAFTNFEKTWERISFRTGQEITTSETLNGTRAVSGDGTTLALHVYGTGDPASTSFQTDFVHEDQSTSRHRLNWQSAFAADVAGSIAVGQPLPAGTWSLSGNSTFTRNPGGASERTWNFSTTGAGVHYDPTCAAAPQFDAGTLTVLASNGQNGNTATFTITFTACGQYTTTITKNVTS